MTFPILLQESHDLGLNLLDLCSILLQILDKMRRGLFLTLHLCMWSHSVYMVACESLCNVTFNGVCMELVHIGYDYG